MIITEIDTSQVIKAPYGPRTEVHAIIAKVETDEGLAGYGDGMMLI